MKIAGIDYKSVYDFYNSRRWRKVKAEVLAMDRNECQRCKAETGRIVKAQTVHHVHHVKDRPDLALDIWDEDGERNLISLCFACHNREHPEKMPWWMRIKKKDPITEEDWTE